MSSLASVLPGSGAAFLLLGEVPRMTEASSVTVLLAWAGGALLLGWLRLSADRREPVTGAAARSVDVLVVGAGLAGLHTATLLARRGHDVLLAERRPTLTGAIRTTGIFVRKTLDDFPLPPECLGPPIRRVVLYPPGLRRPVTLVSDRDEYRVGDMAPLYVAAARAAADAGVRIALGTRYAGRQDDDFLLAGRDGPTRVRARFVVGADGARSRVARDLGLDRNRHLLVGAEEVFDVPPRRRAADVPLRARPLARARLPGLGGQRRAARPRRRRRLRRPLPRRAAPGPGDGSAPRRPGCAGVDRPDEVERRGGPIPVGGLLRRISCADGLLVGDAAGAVSPLTAGGLDPCLRLSELAAAVLDDALRAGRPDALAHYDGAALRAALPRPAAAAPGAGPGAHAGRRDGGVRAAAHAGRAGRRPPHPLRRPVLPRSRLTIRAAATTRWRGPGQAVPSPRPAARRCCRAAPAPGRRAAPGAAGAGRAGRGRGAAARAPCRR